MFNMKKQHVLHIIEPTLLFISTAKFIDLRLCDFLLKTYQHSKVFLHFHQFNLTKNKIDFLNTFDTKQPNLFFLAPTTSLIDVFIKAGVKNSHIVPCSSYPFQKNYLDNNILLFEKII